MCPKSINNQQLVMEVAEAEFLEKGYAKARTTEIAKRAGVYRTMFHYYFQNKEKLFHIVLEDKVKMIHQVLPFHLDEYLSFPEKNKIHIEKYFDFIAANDKIPGLIIPETLRNSPLRDIVANSINDKIKDIFVRLKEEINNEVRKGTIRYVDPYFLIFSIVSLNNYYFLNYQILSGISITVREKKNRREKRKNK